MIRFVLLAGMSAFFSMIVTCADAQTAKDIVGTWSVISSVAQQGANKIDTLGPNPRGILQFGSDGHFSLILLRSDLPKIASNSRTNETPDEMRAIALGGLSYFGTYSVADKTLVLHIDGSSFPNWNGQEQRRQFTVDGDKLTYTSPGATGMTTQVVMQRAK